MANPRARLTLSSMIRIRGVVAISPFLRELVAAHGRIALGSRALAVAPPSCMSNRQAVEFCTVSPAFTPPTVPNQNHVMQDGTGTCRVRIGTKDAGQGQPRREPPGGLATSAPIGA